MEKRVIIKRPISEVFEYVADCRNSAGYLGRTFHFEAITPPPYGVGTKAAAIGTYMGIPIRLNYNMTEFQPNRMLRLVAPTQKLNGVPVDSEAVWRFQEREPGVTLVSFRLVIEPRMKGFGAFANWMSHSIIGAAEASVGTMLEKAMWQLKRNLEKPSVAA